LYKLYYMWGVNVKKNRLRVSSCKVKNKIQNKLIVIARVISVRKRQVTEKQVSGYGFRFFTIVWVRIKTIREGQKEGECKRIKKGVIFCQSSKISCLPIRRKRYPLEVI